MVEQVLSLYGHTLLPMLGWVVFWYVLSILLKRNDIVDIAWGLGFVFFGFLIALNTAHGPVQYIIYGMVALWALRLAIYLLLRLKGKGEDFRYLNWRKEWGSSFYLRSFFQVYVLQSLLLMIIALPLVISSINAQLDIKWTFIPGVFLWLIGFYWQAVGDAQLQKFKNSTTNKGKIIQSGLWAYTRHPNYFGELCMWWGIWICLSIYPFGWLALVSPLLISWLIVKVSGIPMLEAKYRDNPDFQAYKKKVPALIPAFKKQKSN